MNKKVKAAKGLKVFFPRGVMAAPGGSGFVLEGDTVVTTDASQGFVHKRLRAGDLVEVKETTTTPTFLNKDIETDMEGIEDGD